MQLILKENDTKTLSNTTRTIEYIIVSYIDSLFSLLVYVYSYPTPKDNSESSFWEFVQGLKWLSPSHAPVIEKLLRHAGRKGVHRGEVGQGWLRDSVQDHSFLAQLDILLGNPEHLQAFYHGERK